MLRTKCFVYGVVLSFLIGIYLNFIVNPINTVKAASEEVCNQIKNDFQSSQVTFNKAYNDVISNKTNQSLVKESGYNAYRYGDLMRGNLISLSQNQCSESDFNSLKQTFLTEATKFNSLFQDSNLANLLKSGGAKELSTTDLNYNMTENTATCEDLFSKADLQYNAAKEQVDNAETTINTRLSEWQKLAGAALGPGKVLWDWLTENQNKYQEIPAAVNAMNSADNYFGQFLDTMKKLQEKGCDKQFSNRYNDLKTKRDQLFERYKNLNDKISRTATSLGQTIAGTIENILYTSDACQKTCTKNMSGFLKEGYCAALCLIDEAFTTFITFAINTLVAAAGVQ
jgi:hypothetical protein